MKRVVTIGGGSGQHVLLRGLSKYKARLSAIVSMADDGGSTGKLRDELGVHAPGDVRQCVIALSHTSDLIEKLMSYRFEGGALAGHSFGNLMLSALEKITGNFEAAVEEMGRFLAVEGQVIPVTMDQVRLNMRLGSGKFLGGEREIYLADEFFGDYKEIFLSPKAKASLAAVREIIEADMVVVGPGGFFTSIVPNLLVDGVAKALRESQAVKVFVVNLMNRGKQTAGFTVDRYLKELEKFIGEDLFDYILVNDERPAENLSEFYALEGEFVSKECDDPRVIYASMLGAPKMSANGDLLPRSLACHDSARLARQIIQLAEGKHPEQIAEAIYAHHF